MIDCFMRFRRHHSAPPRVIRLSRRRQQVDLIHEEAHPVLVSRMLSSRYAYGYDALASLSGVISSLLLWQVECLARSRIFALSISADFLMFITVELTNICGLSRSTKWAR